MFFHIYKYRLISFIKQKDEFFWILIFPIILATCFYFAFSNVVASTENFETINVAVVLNNNNIDDETSFKSTMNSLSKENDNNKAIFNATYTNLENGKELLENDDISGIITFDNNELNLLVKKNGINETIIKSVLDKYKQTNSIINNSAKSQDDISLILNSIQSEVSHIKELNLTNGNTDNTLNLFYSLIAMTCMLAAMSGQVCSTDVKANLSPLGMRKTLASVNRFKIVLGDFLAAFTVHFISNSILIFYLMYILNINLGGSFFSILLVTMFGSLIALSIGVLIGSIKNISETTKSGINTAFVLISSFLSGLVIADIKNIIENSIPILNRINPATLISDALYSLNIYDTYDQYFSKLIIMGIMCIVLFIVSYFITRREQYDNI